MKHKYPVFYKYPDLALNMRQQNGTPSLVCMNNSILLCCKWR